MEKRFKQIYLLGVACIIIGFFTFFYGTIILPGLGIQIPLISKVPLWLGITIGVILAIIGLVCIIYVTRHANLSDDEKKKLGM
jgi:hypothetical protein